MRSPTRGTCVGTRTFEGAARANLTCLLMCKARAWGVRVSRPAWTPFVWSKITLGFLPEVRSSHVTGALLTLISTFGMRGAATAAFLGAHYVPPLGPVDVAEFVAGADLSDLVCERVVCGGARMMPSEGVQS